MTDRTYLYAGDAVRTNDGLNTLGAIVDHPTNYNLRIAAFDDFAVVTDRYGCYPSDGSLVAVNKVDPTREAWDGLNYYLREVLTVAAETRKITAIKALRVLTGLGLTEAKRAIETFAVTPTMPPINPPVW